MSLIVTGTIGIDTIHTPHGSAEAVLGGSCTYFAAAASFFTPVRMVAAVGGDFHEGHRRVFTHFPNVSVEGIELREESRTFAWGGRYFDDMNSRETLFTELGVVAEKPPVPPASYRDSKFVFLANTHPAVQADLLGHFPDHELVVSDTMNLWIDIARADLIELLKKVDGLVLNDEEARLLTGKRNPITAGKHILDMGPTFALIKKGEHGAILVHRDGVAALPAFPTEVVIDPTGAGDSFAGGMMGHIAATHAAGKDPASMETIQRAMAYGTVIASYTIEAFSLERLTRLTDAEVEQRLKEFVRTVRVG
ncbi:MAG: sugar kinase [Phycisphaeraceae bacterium]|nr:sugar kinase [Phycisphaeraceae bacterium]